MTDNNQLLKTIINTSIISCSFVILIIAGLLRNDFFILKEAEPYYYQLHTNMQRINHFRENESAFLCTAAMLILGLIIVNIVIELLHKRNNTDSGIKLTGKTKAASFILFFANLLGVLISGFFVSISLSFIDLSALPAGENLLDAAHRLYLPIDIMLLLLLIQMAAVLFIKNNTLNNTALFIISTALPYLLFPLFFL